MKCSKTENLKRCRPLLGTYVSVSVTAASERLAELAVNRAFQAVERVQSSMSAHDPQSDLGRLTQQKPFEPLEVDPWAHEVLVLAQKLSFLSGGLFDVTVGAGLEKMGFLPALGKKAQQGATYTDLELMAGNRVMTRRPCRLDLGGIAKGFAVDKAVEAAWRGPGIQAVTVNAGGDIRMQAHVPQELWFRDPFRPGLYWQAGMVKEGSFAGSGGTEALRDSNHGLASPLLRPGQITPPSRIPGILVAAPTCVVADALTKIVSLAAPSLAEPIVASFGAQAWIASNEQGFQELALMKPAQKGSLL